MRQVPELGGTQSGLEDALELPSGRSACVRAPAAAHLCAHLFTQVCAGSQLACEAWAGGVQTHAAGTLAGALCHHASLQVLLPGASLPLLPANEGRRQGRAASWRAAPALPPRVRMELAHPLWRGGQQAAPGCGQGLKTQGLAILPTVQMALLHPHPTLGQLSHSWAGGRHKCPQQNPGPDPLRAARAKLPKKSWEKTPGWVCRWTQPAQGAGNQAWAAGGRGQGTAVEGTARQGQGCT